MPTLLLADDNVTIQRVIALTFADPAFQVVTVGSSQQARDLMAGMRPDIVLASTSLPRNSGYELSEYMLGVETLKDVPVLLLSGAFESVDEARLTTSGARGVIEKPLEPTAVINRVRELLGLKAQPVPPAGRLLTPAAPTADKKTQDADMTPPVTRKAPVESHHRDPLAEAVARAAESRAPAQARTDYRDTLDTALDSLDQHLAGRTSESRAASDSSSPGGPLGTTGDGGAPNAVFEVDNDWFADDPKPRDRSLHHDILADANAAMPRAAAPVEPIFEVDDDWFAEDEKARQPSLAQQRELAPEMGIHEIELPSAEPAPNGPVPVQDPDFDFGLDDVLSPKAAVEPAPTPSATASPERTVAARLPELPAPAVSVPEASAHEVSVHEAPAHPVQVHPAPPAPPALFAPLAPSSVAPSSVADDFAALLAIETGDAPPLAATPPVVVQAVAPEITDAMLDQIAQRVADRLSGGTLGAELREAMTATLRDSVRSVVSETAERLVREEIARVKARTDRDTP